MQKINNLHTAEILYNIACNNTNEESNCSNDINGNPHELNMNLNKEAKHTGLI